MRRLTRSHHDRMLSGVSGGLGEYLDVDPTLVRLGWVLAVLATCGAAILLYAACWFIMPTPERAYPYQ